METYTADQADELLRAGKTPRNMKVARVYIDPDLEILRRKGLAEWDEHAGKYGGDTLTPKQIRREICGYCRDLVLDEDVYESE